MKWIPALTILVLPYLFILLVGFVNKKAPQVLSAIGKVFGVIYATPFVVGFGILAALFVIVWGAVSYVLFLIRLLFRFLLGFPLYPSKEKGITWEELQNPKR